MYDTVICFDLDDTLYKEIDYVQSAFREIAVIAGHPEAFRQMMEWYYEGKDVFAKLIEEYGLALTKYDCLKRYREHYPAIALAPGVKDYLNELKESGAVVGLITDGRSLSQRNKIKALGLDGFFDIVVISEEVGAEKPSLRNYQIVMEKYSHKKRFIYVGDNPAKDFIAPNQLGWRTYCLKSDGRNIHNQTFSINKDYLPQYVVNSITDIL